MTELRWHRRNSLLPGLTAREATPFHDVTIQPDTSGVLGKGFVVHAWPINNTGPEIIGWRKIQRDAKAAAAEWVEKVLAAYAEARRIRQEANIAPSYAAVVARNDWATALQAQPWHWLAFVAAAEVEAHAELSARNWDRIQADRATAEPEPEGWDTDAYRVTPQGLAALERAATPSDVANAVADGVTAALKSVSGPAVRDGRPLCLRVDGPHVGHMAAVGDACRTEVHQDPYDAASEALGRTATAYGAADYRQPLTDFERRAGVLPN